MRVIYIYTYTLPETTSSPMKMFIEILVFIPSKWWSLFPFSSYVSWTCPGIYHTVDGRNPVPVDVVNIPLFTEFYTSQLVQDFFHQQYQQLHLFHVRWSGAARTLRQWPAGASAGAAGAAAGAPPPPPPGQRAAGQEIFRQLPWNSSIALDSWLLYTHPKT